MSLPVMTAIRTALRKTLIGDGLLVSLLGGPRVYHRYLRKAAEIPSVTYFESTSHPERVIPRFEARVQIDVWDRTIDDAELKAQRITQLLDLYEAADAGCAPFRVVTGEANVLTMRLEAEYDDVAGESPTIARKTLMFGLAAVQLA